MPERNRIRREIDRLKLPQDHGEIVRLIVCDGFLWDFNRSLELALFRTFASPSIGGLLARTGEFARSGQKRYDDTSLLMLQLLRFGYDSPRGKAALQRINRTHAHFSIRNEDYLFVLSTFMLDPIDWIQRFGWRTLTDKEQDALFIFWRNVGRRMGIEQIPTSLPEMREYSDDYVRAKFEYSDSNRTVSGATFGVVESWLPDPLRRFVRPVSAVLLDEATRRAVQLEPPGRFYSAVVPRVLKLRATWLSLFGRSGEPKWPDGYRTYPQGYAIEDLVPAKLQEAEKRQIEQAADLPG
ncbi:oxygenase MpaB family protein [Microbulbifer bruguierae]|uniref:Oxygenase MpaB family protein n=1 Tax=Microbulbifer bruguierae TaxID=3029061 RepID=A0ABY8NA94_9GAMM|nr:oxygenase MpaB family protein [Microbulbifer bruguierae]WGL15395.1 oxygenase MpaB family protein [Microbulbifer bruguierae]